MDSSAMLQAVRPLQRPHQRAAGAGPGQARPSTVGLGSKAHPRSDDPELRPKELGSVQERALTALPNKSWPTNATATQTQPWLDQTQSERRNLQSNLLRNVSKMSWQQELERADAFPRLGQAKLAHQTHNNIASVKYVLRNDSLANDSDQFGHADTIPRLAQPILAQTASTRAKGKSYLSSGLLSWSSEAIPLLVLVLAVGAIVLSCFASVYFACFGAVPTRSIESSNTLRRSFTKPPTRHNLYSPYLANTSATLPPRTTTSRLHPALNSQPQRAAMAWPLSPGPSFSQLPMPVGANSQLSLPTSSLAVPPNMAQQEPLLPLCPALVLPARDAHLEISVDALLDARNRRSGYFDVLGPLGNRFLCVTVDGDVLDVRMVQQRERIASVSLQISDGPSIEIRRPCGTIYGRIIEQPSELGGYTSFAVVADQGEQATPLLLVTAPSDVEQQQLLAPLSAAPFGSSSPAGSTAVQRKRGMSSLYITVVRNADTALILSSFLAIALLLHPRGRRDCHNDKDIAPTPAQGGA